MRTLGLDIGDRRTGVAISDPGGILASPLTVLAERDEDATIGEVVRLVEEYNAGRIIVGLPRCLDGNIGVQASKVTAFVERLRRAVGARVADDGLGDGERRSVGVVDIQMWDERLSTKAAERLIMEAGGRKGRQGSGSRRRGRSWRSGGGISVDAVAAAYILQGFLDSLREEEHP